MNDEWSTMNDGYFDHLSYCDFLFALPHALARYPQISRTYTDSAKDPGFDVLYVFALRENLCHLRIISENQQLVFRNVFQFSVFSSSFIIQHFQFSCTVVVYTPVTPPTMRRFAAVPPVPQLPYQSGPTRLICVFAPSYPAFTARYQVY